MVSLTADMSPLHPDRNLALELVRATEAAAIRAVPFIGRGAKEDADGAAVDVDGNYWCAMYEGGRVVQLSPEGVLLREFEVPARCPTMPCFGGPDGRTLFLTTGRHGRPAEELAALPWSGHVLALNLADQDAPGLPVNFFID